MKQAIFICSLALVMVGLLPPPFFHPRESGEIRFANRNAKDLYTALCEFEAIFGHLPTTDIPDELIQDYPRSDRTDSNYLLGQLIAAGLLDNEELFVIKHPLKPDNVIAPLDRILEAGECQFSYISQAGGHPYSTSYGSSACPILIYPMIPKTYRFDPGFFEDQKNQGYYLSLDGSIKKVIINDKGFGCLKGHGDTTLFTSGPDTIWGDDTPSLHHPLPYDGEPTAE